MYENIRGKLVIAICLICLTSILCLMDQNFSPTHYLLPVFEYSPYLKLKDLKKESCGQKMGKTDKHFSYK